MDMLPDLHFSSNLSLYSIIFVTICVIEYCFRLFSARGQCWKPVKRRDRVHNLLSGLLK